MPDQGGLVGHVTGPTKFGDRAEPPSGQGGSAGRTLGLVLLGCSADNRAGGPSGQGGLCDSASGPILLGCAGDCATGPSTTGCVPEAVSYNWV